jgi:hypothetical protein
VTRFPGLGLLRGLRPDRCHQLTTCLPVRRAGCPAVRATPDGSHVHLTNRSTSEASSSTPAASPRLHRRSSPWPPGRLSHRDREFPGPAQRSRVRTATSPYPPDLSWWAVKGRQTLVSRVHLLVSLTGPASSGSTDASRRCQGCSHPHQHLLDQAALSFTQPLRRPGDEGLSPPSDFRRLVAHVVLRPIDPTKRVQGISLSVLGTPVKVGVCCHFCCWSSSLPGLGGRWVRVRGHGGAPAAQRGRTTLTPAADATAC